MPSVGYKHSKAVRAKMSASHAGVPLSAAHCAALSEAHTGRKHTAETCAKLRALNMGNKNAEGCTRSKEVRDKIAASNTGQRRTAPTCAKLSALAIERFSDPTRHPRWRGGISREPYGWGWNNELKEVVRHRDGYTCQLCGVSQSECSRTLDVHHINYNKRDCDPLNLVALCHACHLRTSGRRKYWTQFFERRMLSLNPDGTPPPKGA